MRRNFVGVNAPAATLPWDGSEAALRDAARAAVTN
jgi:hypothetical protein